VLQVCFLTCSFVGSLPRGSVRYQDGDKISSSVNVTCSVSYTGAIKPQLEWKLEGLFANVTTLKKVRSNVISSTALIPLSTLADMGHSITCFLRYPLGTVYEKRSWTTDSGR
jgi:hypothetical protein